MRRLHPGDHILEAGAGQGDLLELRVSPIPQVLLINFLLHQFTDSQLARLGRSIAEIPVWIFCEPYRSRLPLVALALLRPLGLHPISSHDGKVRVIPRRM